MKDEALKKYSNSMKMIAQRIIDEEIRIENEELAAAQAAQLAAQAAAEANRQIHHNHKSQFQHQSRLTVHKSNAPSIARGSIVVR